MSNGRVTEPMHLEPSEAVVCATEGALLVEDVVLLTSARSRGARGTTDRRAVIGAAVFLDLAMKHLVEARSGVFSTYLQASGDVPPEDRVLRLAWEHVAVRFTSARTAFPDMGEALLRPVMDRLEDAGHLRVQSGLVFGAFPKTSAAPASSRRPLLLDRIHDVLADGHARDAHTLLLIALLSAGGAVAWFGLDRMERAPAEARARRIQRGDWSNDGAIGMTETSALIVRSLAGRHA